MHLISAVQRSYNGTFNENDIPKGIQDWINDRSEIIKFLEADKDIEVDEDIEEQWDCFAPPIDKEEIKTVARF